MRRFLCVGLAATAAGLRCLDGEHCIWCLDDPMPIVSIECESSEDACYRYRVVDKTTPSSTDASSDDGGDDAYSDDDDGGDWSLDDDDGAAFGIYHNATRYGCCEDWFWLELAQAHNQSVPSTPCAFEDSRDLSICATNDCNAPDYMVTAAPSAAPEPTAAPAAPRPTAAPPGPTLAPTKEFEVSAAAHARHVARATSMAAAVLLLALSQ